ncbi:MAG: YihA family ribosome biogenesis GTP-binding protein [Candidatus Pacebacteria bacterium]|nr:YihA family ribosome biogenesis GTP-binding protein [Candidatus Paceibacterota bacterium]
MNIKSAEFVKGVVIGEDRILEENRLQIAFIGRSNVGKSSVINLLLGRKKLVKSSSTPGKTRQINFFLVNERIYFVDLPGYGFAKASFEQREKIRRLILWYLTSVKIKNRKIILIIDAKVGLTKLDLEMIDILNKHNHNFIIIANKSDKLKRSERNKKLNEILEKVYNKEIILCSAKNGEGRGKLFNKVFED